MSSGIEFWQYLTGHFNYIVVITLMMTGLYIVISTGNLVKKLVGLGVFQTAVFQLYITMGKVTGGQPPILEGVHESATGEATKTVAEHGEAAATTAATHGEKAVQATISIAKTMDDVLVDGVLYSNPLPHVLILTAIVVGVATLAVGLALVVRIRESYGTIEEDELQEANYQHAKGTLS
ncbi:MAG: cation:proton antiporter subunit C [Robiginitomaculum sp.]|nr:cation:proton antiporter subunit C [Robiginitomaculum sp.]MDQ7078046.1 cation:proton antiporter subunit C [Robiginitomaculum sp.]